jgi:urease accessory protein
MSYPSNSFLTLLHLADSALPIGSAAHSYGLETLVADGDVTVAQLAEYFRIYLEEAGVIEAGYVRRAFTIGSDYVNLADSAKHEAAWLMLNRALSARKIARESREASAVLGRRLLHLALSLHPDARLQDALEAGQHAQIHHATAFGLIGGVWGLGKEETVLAFLQQTLTGLVSACQRLMPLGQNHAQTILWSLQPTLIDVARRSDVTEITEEPASFTPLLEIGSMRHPGLPVRLFIS